MSGYMKPDRSQVVYLHLAPGRASRDLVVAKVAKSLEAQVDPGVVIVKAKITVPGNFFEKALPFVEITFQPGDEITPDVTISAVSDAS